MEEEGRAWERTGRRRVAERGGEVGREGDWEWEG